MSSFRLVFSIHLRVGSRIMFRTLGLVGKLGRHLEIAFSKRDFVAIFLYSCQFIRISYDYISITAKATLIPNTKIFLMSSLTSYILELALPVVMGVMGNLLHSTSFSAVST